MRARIGEGAAGGQPFLEADDAMHGGEPRRRLQNLPARQVAKAHLENVEIERRIEIVAVWALAVEIVDPGRNPALIVDIVVERHGHARRVDAGADLVAGVEVQQRLIDDGIRAAGLRRRRDRAGRGVAIRHVDSEAEILLDLREVAGKARMRRRRERGDDVEARAVDALDLLAADVDAEIDHVGDRALRRDLVGRRGEPGLDITQQRLDEERIVIGRAVPDLHRLPHRLGNALPGRIDHGARRRVRDEDAGEVEQQRGVLVAARVEARQRHDQLASTEIGIADQVEGGIGRQETVAAVRAEQVLRAVTDRAVDLRALRQGGGERHRRRLGMIERDAVDKIGNRPPDRRPVRLDIVAGVFECLAQPGQPGLVAQLGQAGAAEQHPQRGIAEGGLVEFGQMQIAADRVRQYGIADVVKRRAVLPHRQRPAGGAGKIMKAHEIPGRGGLGRGRRAPSRPHTTPCKSLKRLPGFAENTNVMIVTEKTGAEAA